MKSCWRIEGRWTVHKNLCCNAGARLKKGEGSGGTSTCALVKVGKKKVIESDKQGLTNAMFDVALEFRVAIGCR